MPQVIFTIACMILSCCVCVHAQAQQSTLEGPVLTSIAAVLDATISDAGGDQRAIVRGVVTYYKPGAQLQDLLIHDGTHALYVVPPKGSGKFKAGQFVEVEGKTYGKATYAPSIRASRILILGTMPVPDAVPIDLRSVAAIPDGSRVRVRGVIQAGAVDLSLDPPRLILDIITNGGPLRLWILHFAPEDAARFIDSEVEVTGSCLHFRNHLRQPTTTRMVMNDCGEIVVLDPGAADPFAGPLIALDQLMHYSKGDTWRRRIRIAGTVTYYEPGRVLFIQNGDFAVRTRMATGLALLPGQGVELAGFLRIGPHTAELDHAVARVSGEGVTAPVPDRAEKPGPTSGWDARLVRDRGILRDRLTIGGAQMLMLDGEHGRFEAILAPSANQLVNWEAISLGSDVRVTGVHDGISSERERLLGEGPSRYRLLMRGPADLEMVRAGPWWTSQRLNTALLVSALGVGILALWSVLLRKKNRRLRKEVGLRMESEAKLEALNRELENRVQQRSEQLAAEISARQETEIRCAATSAERSRLARDLHDSVEQMLTGANCQLVLLRKGLDGQGEAFRRVELVRSILHQARLEARRTVWDLRPHLLEEHALPQALGEVIEQLTPGGSLEVDLQVTGAITRLPLAVDRELLRIGQEAITNAVKHASDARRIEVRIEYGDDSVALSVSDDGAGFDVQRRSGAESGHFGLDGMLERARRIGGGVSLSSEPGRTSVKAVVPLTHDFAGLAQE